MSEGMTRVFEDATEQTIPTLTEAIQYVGGGGGVISVNGKTGIVNLTSSDVGALPSSTVIPVVNDGTLTIQKNGSTIESFSANSLQNKIANISVPTALSDLTNDAGFVQISDVTGAIATHNSSTGAHPSILASITTINSLIPLQATSSNKLADKAFVNSTIQTATSNFRGSWATWSAVPTDATLYPADYTGSTTPTNNDYMVVQDASGYPVGEGETALVGTWRFKYTGNWATTGKNGWKQEYQVNEEPLTAAQIAALNSGITSTLVTQIGTNTTAIAGKVDAVEGKGLSTNDFTTALQTKLSGLADITSVGSGLTLQNGTLSNALTAGTNVSITDNVISATDTTYSPFTGATSAAAGAAGLVPAPATTDVDKFLKGDGTWGEAAGGGGPTVVQSTGTSTTDVMSQNAVTSTLFDGTGGSTLRHIKIGRDSQTTGSKNIEASVAIGGGAKASGSFGVAIGGYGTNGASAISGKGSVTIGGYNPTASGEYSIAIGGYGANAAYTGSIALGSGATPTAIGEMNIGDVNGWYGYNNSNYRLLTGLYDGQSAHDAATVGQLNATIDAINAALNASISHVGA